MSVFDPAVEWLSEKENRPADQKPPIVLVEWEDAVNVADWEDRDDAATFDGFEFDFHCTTVGYLIRDDDECVVVAGRATGCFQKVGLFERIPRGMVKRVVALTEERP